MARLYAVDIHVPTVVPKTHLLQTPWRLGGVCGKVPPVDPAESTTRSIKGKVKRKIFPIAGISLAFRPRGLSRMCLDRPHHSLGSWAWVREVGGFSRSGCHCLMGDEACSVPKPASRAALKWRPWFYLGLVAHSFFWLSERA